jgi:YbbR domain-containing protein
MSLEFNTLVKKIFFNWHVKVLSLTAAVLLFVFNRMINLEENILTIPLVLLLHDDFSVSSPLVRETVNITIRGDKELEINKITKSDVEVYADLTQFTNEAVYTVKLQYTKKGIATALTPISVSLDPQEIKVSIEKTMQKSVKIEASIKAGPPEGYDYSYSLIPSTAVILGPKSLVDATQLVKTEGIDLSEKTDNFSLPVKLVPPDNLVRFKESGQVEFYCIINQLIVEKIVEVRILPVNLNARLTFESKLPTIGSLVLKVSPQVLESLSPDDVSLIIDCSNIKSSGKYIIKTKPIVPEGIVVVSFSPEEITLDVSGL